MKCASNDWLHVHLSNKQQEYKLKISHRIYVHVIYDTRDINMPVREQENDGGTGQVAGHKNHGWPDQSWPVWSHTATRV